MHTVQDLVRALRNTGGENAPCVFLLGFYICVSVLACLTTGCRFVFVLLPAVLIVLIRLFWKGKQLRERCIVLLLCAASLTSGLFSLLYHDVWRASFRKMIGETRCGEGIVTEVISANAYSGSYIIRFRDDGYMLPYTICLRTAIPSGWQIGEKIHGSIVLSEWEEDGGFDTEKYYGAKGVVLCADSVDCVSSAGEISHTPLLWFRRLNQALSAALSAHIRDGGLSAAVFLGNRSGLSSMTKLWFRRIGVYHLLAVSGTHLGILVTLTERLLVRRRWKPKGRAVVLALLCVFYMALTGFSASVKRAGIMYIAALFFRARGSDIRSVYALSLAAAGIVLVSPSSVWDIGLQLSVCAVAGCDTFLTLLSHHKRIYRILAGKRAVTRCGKWIRKWRFSIASSVCMTLLVTTILLPLSFFYFGEVSLVGFIANLIYIPAITGEICLTIAYLFLYPLRIAILPLSAVIEGYTALLLYPAKAAAEIRGICVSLNYPGLWLWLLPIMALTLLLPYIGRRRWLYAMYAGVFALFGCHIGICRAVSASQDLIVYESDGKRDGFVLQSGRQVYLMDVSDGSYTFTKQLTDSARDRCATELAGYVITHYHKRHTASFQKLCGDWIVYGLYLPEPQTDAERAVYSSLIRLAEEYDVPVTVMMDEIAFGRIGTRLAARTYISRSTHPITAFCFCKDRMTVVYGSSSWNEGVPELAEWFAGADVLLFGAHAPVYKKPFAVERTGRPSAVVWNGRSADFGGAIPAEYTAYDREECIVRLR